MVEIDLTDIREKYLKLKSIFENGANIVSAAQTFSISPCWTLSRRAIVHN